MLRLFVDGWFSRDRLRSRTQEVRPQVHFRPQVETLEDRAVPAINFVFDFSHDTTGFFNNNPAAVTALELAGQQLGAHLTDTLTAITPSGGNTWSATFLDPTTRVDATVNNLTVPAGTLIIYAGGHNYGGVTVGEGGYGGWSATGNTTWFSTVSTRGQPGAANSTDVGPWGGSVSFDTATNWNFGGLNSPPGPGQTDFLSVAEHELGHVLGFGTAPSWFAQVANGTFNGANATAVNNGQHPQVTSSQDHWAQTDIDPTEGQPDMTPVIQTSARKLFTNLDYAALADIGWQLTGVNFTPVSLNGGGTPTSSVGTTSGAQFLSVTPANAAGGEPTGAFDPSTATWVLRSSPTPGFPDVGVFQFGMAGWDAITGDWTGTGHTGIGVFDPSTATWYLRSKASAGGADVGVFQFGAPGWIPVVGDWTGTGHTGIGVVDPHTGTWYLRSSPSAGGADVGVFQFGAAGWVPVTGDWTGTGKTGIGMFDPGTATWYLRSSASAGLPNAGSFQYGVPGWTPLTGDWNGDGKTTVGLVDPNTETYYLRNENSAGVPDAGTYEYGLPNWTPVAGFWNGQQSSARSSQALQTAPDHSLDAALFNSNLSIVSGHMAGGYCHCAFCQAAARAAAAAATGNSPPGLVVMNLPTVTAPAGNP
jgi:hypothetical protein